MVNNKFIVAKFGGSSLATAQRIKQAVKIIRSNPRRRYIVLSAPGRRNSSDNKITDLLYKCSKLAEKKLAFDDVYSQITERFIDISTKLGSSSIKIWLDEVYNGIKEGKSEDWIVSRGEWVMAQIFSQYIGGVFIDAADVIRIKDDGDMDPSTETLMRSQLSSDSIYVIPGFYGKSAPGSIKVFPRGGSDITGAIVAKCMRVSEYENWTDVDGVYTAQPSLVSRVKLLESLTFREMRELGYRGAEVLQPDALLPLIKLNVPIRIKNTFRPNKPGTLILTTRQVSKNELIIGIAGKQGFTTIQIQKYGMNEETGILEKITLVFELNKISFEHTPTGLDTVSIIVDKKEVEGKIDKVLTEIQESINPDNLSVLKHDLGLICVVGEGILSNKLAHTKVAAILFNTLNTARIDSRAIISAPSAIDIVVAVDQKDLKRSLIKLHAAFFN